MKRLALFVASLLVSPMLLGQTTTASISPDAAAAPVFSQVTQLDQNAAAAKPAEQLGPLSPEEAAKSFKVADDLVFEQVLAEPIVAQPVFLTFDERGRMWVVQYRQYPDPAGLKMVSRDNFWRAVYDKVPPPPPNHFKGADKITIHEDTDGDGAFDKHKTFLDGLNIATSVAFGRGGVFVLNPPYLLFYPDRNRDDVPDGDPQVLLSGFGLEDTHSVANSLRWGPDGWLYGCQGSTVTGNILVYGADGKALNEKPIYSQGQNIWRYHPEKRIYEVFSEGGGNAFGLEIDSAGRIFSGHNGGNTRGFHYMQGAYLQKGFDKHGPLSNPYAFGYFPQMPHPDVDRFTHNFVIYDSGALGERYQGKLFGVEPLQGRIVLSEITPDGSTFRTRDLGYPVTSDDKWFRPVDIKLGPDGALYVCDWYDRQVNHYRNHEGQMDASNGRIYRLRAKDTQAPTARQKVAQGVSPGAVATNGASPERATQAAANDSAALTGLDRRASQTPGSRPGLPSVAPPALALHDLASLSTSELMKLLASSNRWVRFEALRLMADSRSSELKKAVLELAIDHPGPSEIPPQDRARFGLPNNLEVLWAASTCFDGPYQSFLTSPDPLTRAWAVRLLGDSRSNDPNVAKLLMETSSNEPSLEVRTQLACTAKRLPAKVCLSIVSILLTYDRDAADPRQPLLLWWAIEDKCATDRDAVLALFADRELWRAPLVQQHVLSRLMRRFAATGKRDDLLTCAKLFDLSPGFEATARLTQGFEEAYQGRPMVGLPEELLTAMERAGGESVLIGARRGKPAAVEQALALIADPKADASKRLQLIQVLGETRQAGAVPALLAVARDTEQSDLRKAALGALQAYDSPDIAGEVLTQLASYPNNVRTAAFGLLASRATWALALLRAVDTGRLDKAAMPNDVVRRLLSVGADVRRPTSNSEVGGQKSETENQSLLTSAPTEELSRLLTKHWPNVRQATSAELEKEITRLAEVINVATGSPYNGKKLFMENCGVCHKLFTKGGEIGPDLTVYQRGDLPNLLLNIVNPNAEIREGYESFSVETKDGRSLTGFLADQDANVVVLRTPDGQTVPMPRSEIAFMEPAGSSLMPEGLLANLSDQQVRDLFAYLRSTQPLNDGN